MILCLRKMHNQRPALASRQLRRAAPTPRVEPPLLTPRVNTQYSLSTNNSVEVHAAVGDTDIPPQILLNLVSTIPLGGRY